MFVMNSYIYNILLYWAALNEIVVLYMHANLY